MNINTIARDYAAKSLGSENFIIYVADLIERQLKEWDFDYQVFVMKLKNYELMIKNKETYYHVEISENEIESLQKKSLFSLDQKIWLGLQEQGLTIHEGFGDYLGQVLS